MLSEANVGAAKLLLNHRGLALPHYSDSPKLSHVLEGSGIMGFLRPETGRERVVRIRKGDVVPVPAGVISWWLNDGSSSSPHHLVVLFLGDTSKGHRSGEFTNFQLLGRQDGLLNGFGSEFVGRIWNLGQRQVQRLVESQNGSRIVKIPQGVPLPAPGPATSPGDIPVSLPRPEQAAGCSYLLSGDKVPVLNDIGLGAFIGMLHPGGFSPPLYSADSAFQVTYIVRGSGRVQVVGINGQRVLDREIKAGDLFVVPRFFVESKIAGKEGMDWFSAITTPKPVFGRLGGRTSVWKAISPQILGTSFNVTEEMVNVIRSVPT